MYKQQLSFGRPIIRHTQSPTLHYDTPLLFPRTQSSLLLVSPGLQINENILKDTSILLHNKYVLDFLIFCIF